MGGRPSMSAGCVEYVCICTAALEPIMTDLRQTFEWCSWHLSVSSVYLARTLSKAVGRNDPLERDAKPSSLSSISAQSELVI